MGGEAGYEGKSDAMKNALEELFGTGTALAERKCVFCGEEVSEDDLRDETSKREYSISGMCQSCQDEIFGV